MATSKGGARKGSGTTGGAEAAEVKAPAAKTPGGATRKTAKPAAGAAAAPPADTAAAGDGTSPKKAPRGGARKAAGEGASPAKKAVRKATAAAGDAATRAIDTAGGVAERAVDAAEHAGTAARDLVRDLRDWAAPRLAGWSHLDWHGLLDTLRGRGHDVSDSEAVGRSLERERLRLVLEGVEGLSPRRAETLVERYGTLWSIRQVGADEIAASTGVSRELAERVVQRVR